MNILVTGGLGFIGYPIVEFAAANAAVSRVVSLGRSPVPTGVNLPDKVVHHVGDISNREQMEALLIEHQITHVIHAAGLRTSASEQSPSAAIEINVNGTQSMLAAAKEVPSVECFSLLSTGAIYGKVTQPIDESYPVAPPNPYNISKAAAELALADSDLPFRTVIIRPAFVVGQPAQGGPLMGVIQNLLHEAKLGKSSVWSFADRFFLHYCPDVARAVFQLTNHHEASGVFHLPGHPVELEELTQLVTDLCKDIEFLPTDPQVDLPLPTELQFSKYRSLFPNDDPTPLKTILTEILDSMDPRINHLDPTMYLS